MNFYRLKIGKKKNPDWKSYIELSMRERIKFKLNSPDIWKWICSEGFVNNEN